MAHTFLTRSLLGLAALVLFLGGAIHASAFPKAAPIMETAAMPDFFIGAYKALWLVDSTTLFVLAMFYAFLALRPAAASAAVVVILALGPLAAGVLIYLFIGAFFAGHLMMLSGALALAAAAHSRLMIARERVPDAKPA